MNLLMLRKIFRLGTWNARTLNQTGELKEVPREFNVYKLAILGITETTWTCNGRLALDTGETCNGRLTLDTVETMLYSGHEEEQANHSEGLGIMVSRKAAKALLEWSPEGSTIVPAMFKTNKKKINLRVTNCYAPTNEKGEGEKEHFYSRLQDMLEKSKAKDITIIMGDFNAQIGFICLLD
ncbi:endonuclease-reverse transcriptase [Elysia marginata]|uniref:Endonuclease-reverse transcriptase n=1 Tax=Elysia marginata TaxID=1093978 RepID=A0AAV4FMD2_9GAST|nr:endonuclease-reverse transcriptase [Elysia marginata]